MDVKNLHEKLNALANGNVSGWELKAKNRRKNKIEMQELINKVEQWAEDRNFFCPKNGATLNAQFKKLVEEVGELSGNLARGKYIKDDIGDCLVVCIIMAKMLDNPIINDDIEIHRDFSANNNYLELLIDVGDLAFHIKNEIECVAIENVENICFLLNRIAIKNNLTIEECLQVAYNDIKDRKGKFINHVFVKESDL